MTDPQPPLILGLGNVLLSDDGLGVHAVRLLADDPVRLPAGTTVLDGGTGGLSLLPAIAEAGALIIVDAIDVGADPGHIRILTGADLHAAPGKLSVHEVGTADLIAAARLTGVLPQATALVGMQPASLDPGVDLTPPVVAALPDLVATVQRYCGETAKKRVRSSRIATEGTATRGPTPGPRPVAPRRTPAANDMIAPS